MSDLPPRIFTNHVSKPTCDAPCCLPAGFACTASSRCRELVCEAGVGIAAKPCFGLCTAAVRLLTSAKLDNNDRTITVGLSTRAAPTEFPCARLFASSSSKLGAASRCSVDGNTLTIELARDATIMPDDTLMPTANHGVLIDAIDATAQFTATAPGVILTKCDSCMLPNVTVVGPAVSVPLHSV